jgi:hypothetical protein
VDKNHSTASNLLECLQDWSVGLNSHSQTDIVYIDFAKAFDSIVLSKLLYKLEFFGITGQLLEWIRCFLTGRSQCVYHRLLFLSYSGVPRVCGARGNKTCRRPPPPKAPPPSNVRNPFCTRRHTNH